MSLKDERFVLPEIQERSRVAAPGPMPMGLAFENGNLWVGSAKDWIIRGIRIVDGAVFAEAKAPAKPYGCVLVGGTLYVVVGDVDDNRTIRSYPLGKTFTSDSLRCPGDTGNFLAHDGRSLYVSQRYDQLLVKVDNHCNPVETTPMPRQVVGITYLDGLFYLLTTDGSLADDDIRLARMELASGVATITELARVPFGARSLVHDGASFWTSWREQDAIVSFDLT
jgi:hypothetical protein